MKTQEFKIIDRTDGDADRNPFAVIIHDTEGDYPSIIAYLTGIAEALEELVGAIPEEYKYLSEECENAWTTLSEWVIVKGFNDVLGVRIEFFEDFWKEHYGEWNYPDDLLHETQKN